jgi:hypothetical protein
LALYIRGVGGAIVLARALVVKGEKPNGGSGVAKNAARKAWNSYLECYWSRS